MSLSEEENHKDLLRSKGDWGDHSNHVLYKGVWCPLPCIPHLRAFGSAFEARDNDIFVASLPKSGTTWLKALVFSTVHRARYSMSHTPLLSSNPHELVPFVEFPIIHFEPRPDQTTSAGGKLWSTHAPYGLWPDNARLSSRCRVVYVARNPLDVLASGWHFYAVGSDGAKWTAEEYAERFREGDGHSFGPYWSHVLGFWRESLERPDKVLFVKYEELKRDTVAQVKRIAEFVGFGFSEEEERVGAVEEIVEMCSLKRMKSLEVNNNGELFPTYGNNTYFRKGEIGDWVNHITPEMAKRVNDVVDEKLAGSGLSFKM